ncbi:hypothetical protein D3C81_1412850 [compost metagenome]
MTPIFLPHTALDAMGEVGAALLPEAAQQGRMNLRALRDLTWLQLLRPASAAH